MEVVFLTNNNNQLHLQLSFQSCIGYTLAVQVVCERAYNVHVISTNM